ncbi:MAG TPA: SDR family oxidoreductase [Chitinophagales bacterium]|nr:SDR family oxidoreductase [Chitinophagales bacterium]
MELKDKVIWITGASSGIGEALAYALAKEGAKLILSARREDELKRVAAGIEPHIDHRTSDPLILPLDLNDSSNFEEKKNEALKKFGRIDVLINNGGVSQRSLAKDTTIETDRKLFEVNFFGTLALTKVLLPYFIEQKNGLFVTITSAVGKFGSPWRSGYAASKHALHGYFDSLRAEAYDDNVKVLLVCPGFVVTNVSYNALTGNGEKLNSMDNATSKGLTKEECARQIIAAMKSEKEEVIVSNFKEKFGVYVKRFFPSLFSTMIRKMAVR